MLMAAIDVIDRRTGLVGLLVSPEAYQERLNALELVREAQDKVCRVALFKSK